jgi:hypothetical protein
MAVVMMAPVMRACARGRSWSWIGIRSIDAGLRDKADDRSCKQNVTRKGNVFYHDKFGSLFVEE